MTGKPVSEDREGVTYGLGVVIEPTPNNTARSVVTGDGYQAMFLH
ncbi:hypothetical protein [Vreelandella utahensis]|nr:hypothetical protein [Halomonas utahensis]